MNEDVFNGSIRKFLKTLGVSAQREIEKAVRQAVADGKLKGGETLPARATITLGGLNFSHEVTGEIELGVMCLVRHSGSLTAQLRNDAVSVAASGRRRSVRGHAARP